MIGESAGDEVFETYDELIEVGDPGVKEPDDIADLPTTGKETGDPEIGESINRRVAGKWSNAPVTESYALIGLRSIGRPKGCRERTRRR